MCTEDFKRHKCSKIPEAYSVATARYGGIPAKWVWGVINYEHLYNSIYDISYCPFCGQELGSAEPMGTWKEDSLNHKYAAIPEEPPRHKKKKKKKAPKKADHKHEYRNCVIRTRYPDNWTLGLGHEEWTSVFASYCTVCGKLSEPQKDERLFRLCPHIGYHTFFFSWNYNKCDQEEKEDFEEYVNKHYPIFIVEDYMQKSFGGGQIFLDTKQLDSVR